MKLKRFLLRYYPPGIILVREARGARGAWADALKDSPAHARRARGGWEAIWEKGGGEKARSAERDGGRKGERERERESESERASERESETESERASERESERDEGSFVNRHPERERRNREGETDREKMKHTGGKVEGLAQPFLLFGCAGV